MFDLDRFIEDMTFLPHNHQMWAVIGAEPLGRNIIHSVTNPLSRLTGAIHVYGGDFYAAERSQWDPETLLEGPFDFEASACRFEEANHR